MIVIIVFISVFAAVGILFIALECLKYNKVQKCGFHIGQIVRVKQGNTLIQSEILDIIYIEDGIFIKVEKSYYNIEFVRPT